MVHLGGELDLLDRVAEFQPSVPNTNHEKKNKNNKICNNIEESRRSRVIPELADDEVDVLEALRLLDLLLHEADLGAILVQTERNLRLCHKT